MKLHPVSVPYRAVSRGASAGILFLFVGRALSRSEILPAFGGATGVAVAVVGVAAVAAWQVAYYRRFDYELTDDGLVIASGVVSRRHREIPLGRIQNVDISRNAVQRGLGIAALDLETAGGGQTEASLQYVGYDEAKRLQREIQGRKRQTDAGTDDETEELLFELATDELALLSVLSFDLRYLSVLAFGPATLPFVPGFAEVALVGGAALTATMLVALWALSAGVTFARYFDFQLTRVGDELRYERGLLQRHDGSIPLGKIQTLRLEESLPMRRLGYATLAVETAGYGPGQAPAGGSEAAVPLATHDRAVQLAREIEAFDSPEFERPPTRTRRRYAIRYALALAGLSGLLLAVRFAFRPSAPWYLALVPLSLVVFAPVAAHLKWVHRGRDAGERHVFTRNGFWTRTTAVVPYYRVQTVFQTQTVFQRRRRWRLANVVIDTASSGGGAALAADLDEADAERLRELVGERLQASLSKRNEERQQPDEERRQSDEK